MGKLNSKICREGVDFARGFAFLLQTRREADPGPTQNMYRLMLRSATYGGMVLYEDEACGVVGAACYSIGSERADFEDCDVVQVDYILLKPELQGTFYPKFRKPIMTAILRDFQCILVQIYGCTTSQSA